MPVVETKIPTITHRDLISARVEAQIARQSAQSAEREQGLAFARAWRRTNKPIFDAAYGPARCICGRSRGA